MPVKSQRTAGPLHTSSGVTSTLRCWRGRERLAPRRARGGRQVLGMTIVLDAHPERTIETAGWRVRHAPGAGNARLGLFCGFYGTFGTVTCTAHCD